MSLLKNGVHARRKILSATLPITATRPFLKNHPSFSDHDCPAVTKLRDEFALSAHIHDAIQQFVASFRSTPPPGDVQRSIVSNFVAVLAHEFAVWHPLMSQSNFQQRLKSTVLSLIHDALLPEPSIATQDHLLQHQCELLQSQLSLEALAIPQDYRRGAPWQSSQQCLRDMATRKTPQEKIESMIKAFVHLEENLSRHGTSEEGVTADILVPVLVFVVVHACVPSLHEQLAFIMDYGSFGRAGMVSYYLTSLIMAISFVHQLDKELMCLVPPEGPARDSPYRATILLSHMDHSSPTPPEGPGGLDEAQRHTMWWFVWVGSEPTVNSTPSETDESQVLFQGVLMKQNRWRVWIWQPKFCVLRGTTLEYYESEVHFELGSEPESIVPVQHAFTQVFCETDTPCRLQVELVTPERSFIFGGDSRTTHRFTTALAKATRLRVVRYLDSASLETPDTEDGGSGHIEQFNVVSNHFLEDTPLQRRPVSVAIRQPIVVQTGLQGDGVLLTDCLCINDEYFCANTTTIPSDKA